MTGIAQVLRHLVEVVDNFLSFLLVCLFAGHEFVLQQPEPGHKQCKHCRKVRWMTAMERARYRQSPPREDHGDDAA